MSSFLFDVKIKLEEIGRFLSEVIFYTGRFLAITYAILLYIFHETGIFDTYPAYIHAVFIAFMILYLMVQSKRQPIGYTWWVGALRLFRIIVINLIVLMVLTSYRPFASSRYELSPPSSQSR